jgi:hypothetical protein
MLKKTPHGSGTSGYPLAGKECVSMSLSSSTPLATPEEAAIFDLTTVSLDVAGLVVFVAGLFGGFLAAAALFFPSALGLASPTDPLQSVVYPLILVAACGSFALTGARIITRVASRPSVLFFAFLLVIVGLLRLITPDVTGVLLFLVFALAFATIMLNYQPSRAPSAVTKTVDA